MHTKNINILKISILFVIPAIALYLATHQLIPWLTAQNIHPAMSWFIAGLTIFIPLFIFAIVLTSQKVGHSFLAILKELRLKKMSKRDWKLSFGGFLIISILTGLILYTSNILSTFFNLHELNTTPSFLTFEPFNEHERWMLLIWLVMFFFNIMGEEMLWRGVILRRQENYHGNKAWFINGLLWTGFHFSFGLDLIILLLPILFIVPYIVQKTGNTTTGIVIHALINGPSFILISLGLL